MRQTDLEINPEVMTVRAHANGSCLSPKATWANLLIYGAAHGAVDGTCAAVFFTLLYKHSITTSNLFTYAIFYNVVAFGLRAPFGLVVDYFRISRPAAALGCLLVASSAITYSAMPLFALIVVGIGNALYHVGGGGISFNLVPKRAMPPGIFAAPGALGIGVGTVIGKTGHFIAWPFISLLLAFSLLMYTVQMPKMDCNQLEDRNTTHCFRLILLLALLSVAASSFIGLSLVFPWKSNQFLLIILTLAVFLGRGMGGFMADRFGWLPVAVGTLLASIPLLALGSQFPWVAMIGMILFNASVPVALTVISNLLPGRSSFAYGLASLALIIGGLFAFSRFQQALTMPMFVATAILIFALTLYAGLWLFYKNSTQIEIADSSLNQKI